MSIKHLILCLYCSLLLCVSCQPQVEDSSNKSTKILIIGDVQLKSDISRYNQAEWKSQRMDTSLFKKHFHDIIRLEQPDYIFQTGDWVNYNNNLSLRIVDSTGREIDVLDLPYDEWTFMSKQIPEQLKDRFYIAMGNHDSYQEALLQGIHIPGVEVLANIELRKLTLHKTNEKKGMLLERFPHLAQATFHGETGSYAITKDRFTLISIDGLDKKRDELFQFIEYQILEHQRNTPGNDLIVISHYPLFTGRDTSADENLVYSDVRTALIALLDQYEVDVFMNGHEHFYLRYKEKGLKEAGFERSIPKNTKFITISNFSNPYARELERIKNKEDKEALVYFNGIHYTTITLTENGSEFRTFGLINDHNWETIDSFEY